VGRLILMIVLGVVAAYYFPDSRQAIENAAVPIMAPLIRWDTKAKMAVLAGNVLDHERLTGELPDRRSWSGWLDWRYSGEDMRQGPWTSLYQLRVWADSVAIVSSGPDRTSSTEDDFSVVTPRERQGRRRR
jgi:hypothetical protein